MMTFVCTLYVLFIWTIIIFPCIRIFYSEVNVVFICMYIILLLFYEKALNRMEAGVLWRDKQNVTLQISLTGPSSQSTHSLETLGVLQAPVVPEAPGFQGARGPRCPRLAPVDLQGPGIRRWNMEINEEFHWSHKYTSLRSSNQVLTNRWPLLLLQRFLFV